MARFQFPLIDQDDYAGRVSFQAVEIQPANTSIDGGPPIDTSGVDDAAAEDAEGPGIRGIFTQLTDRVNFSGQNEVSFGDRCTLFLPQAITFQDGVVFDEFSLGRVGGSTEAALQNGQNIMNAAGEGLQQNISAITDLFNTAPTGDIARLATSRLARLGGEQLQGGVSSALRVTTNPNKRLLFKEVNIREFSFNFKLIPSSREEAEMITQIIKFFRENLYPEEFSIEGIPIGYRFPNQFDIRMYHDRRVVATKLLRSYLVSMQTTYNPSSMGFFEDGNFTETEITLNFREERALTKSQVSSGEF